jgi:hypothetical protein
MQCYQLLPGNRSTICWYSACSSWLSRLKLWSQHNAASNKLSSQLSLLSFHQ